jgi:hypothetical protein
MNRERNYQQLCTYINVAPSNMQQLSRLDRWRLRCTWYQIHLFLTVLVLSCTVHSHLKQNYVMPTYESNLKMCSLSPLQCRQPHAITYHDMMRIFFLSGSVCMTDSGKPCIFPFISDFSGRTVNECPFRENQDFCATELNSKREFVKFGACGPGCPLHEPKRNECQIKTIQVLKQGSRFIAYYSSEFFTQAIKKFRQSKPFHSG